MKKFIVALALLALPVSSFAQSGLFDIMEQAMDAMEVAVGREMTKQSDANDKCFEALGEMKIQRPSDDVISKVCGAGPNLETLLVKNSNGKIEVKAGAEPVLRGFVSCRVGIERLALGSVISKGGLQSNASVKKNCAMMVK